MSILGVQIHGDFIQGFAHMDTRTQSLNQDFALDEVISMDSPRTDLGNSFYSHMDEEMTDELGLLKVVDDDDTYDSNVQRVFVASPETNGSAMSTSVVQYAPLMSPLPSAAPGPMTSALAVDRIPSEIDVASDDLIEFEEVLPVSGGSDSQFLEPILDNSAESGNTSTPQSAPEIYEYVEVKASTENSQIISFEGQSNDTISASAGDVNDYDKDLRTGQSDKIIMSNITPNQELASDVAGTGDAMGETNGGSDLIEYVEEEEEGVEVDEGEEVNASVAMDKEEGTRGEQTDESPEAFEYAPLPCVLLSYRGETHAMFNVYQGDLDLKPIFDEDQGPILFEGQLTYFISELKSYFEVETDISLEFPHLDIKLHEDMTCVESLSLNRLYEFFLAVLSRRGEVESPDNPFKMILIEHSYSLEKRLADLTALAAEAGYGGSYIEDDEDTAPADLDYTPYEQDIHEDVDRSAAGSIQVSNVEVAVEPDPSEQRDEFPSVQGPTSLSIPPNEELRAREKRASEDSGYEGEVKRTRLSP